MSVFISRSTRCTVKVKQGPCLTVDWPSVRPVTRTCPDLPDSTPPEQQHPKRPGRWRSNGNGLNLQRVERAKVRRTGRKREATWGKWILTPGTTLSPNVTALAPVSVPNQNHTTYPDGPRLQERKKRKHDKNKRRRGQTEALVTPSDGGIMWCSVSVARC